MCVLCDLLNFVPTGWSDPNCWAIAAHATRLQMWWRARSLKVWEVLARRWSMMRGMDSAVH